MNVDEALRQFGESEDLPREAMAWALENWDAAAPRLLSELRAFADGADCSEAAENQVFFILHLWARRARREPTSQRAGSSPKTRTSRNGSATR